MVNYIPSSLDDALEFLASHDAYIVAGGTDLMVLKRRLSEADLTLYIRILPRK